MQMYEQPSSNNPNREELFAPNQMEFMTPWYISLFLFIFGWLGIQIFAIIVSLICGAIWTDETEIVVNVNLITYVVLALGFVLYLILYKKGNIAKAFGRGFKNWRTYVFGIAGFLIMTGLTAIIMVIISSLYPSLGDNQNEGSINQMTELYFARTFIMVVILAPFCEEMTYRYGLFSCIKTKIGRVPAYIISPLVFALIHFDTVGVISELTNDVKNMDFIINELANIPSYLIAGVSLSLAYDLTGNISGSWLLHTINNLIATVV